MSRWGPSHIRQPADFFSTSVLGLSGRDFGGSAPCDTPLRLFARTPLASAAALGALALAIGASTLVFSVVDGILPQPLSY